MKEDLRDIMKIAKENEPIGKDLRLLKIRNLNERRELLVAKCDSKVVGLLQVRLLRWNNSIFIIDPFIDLKLGAKDRGAPLRLWRTSLGKRS